MMRTTILLLLMLASPAALSGCMCEPLVEVRHCREHQNHCAPDADDVRPWTPEDAAQFPEVDAWIRSLEVGTHGHVDYTPEQEDAFWAYWGLDNSAGDQQLFVSHDGGIFRLRVLTCDGSII